MIKTLIGRTDYKIDDVILEKWTTGLAIKTNNVYNIVDGVVIFVGTAMKNTYVVNVQIDATQMIRYINLKHEHVKPNQPLKSGELIGDVDDYVVIEYCNTSEEKDCVRVGESRYYKHNPYPFLFNGVPFQINGVSAYKQAITGQNKDVTQLIKHDHFCPYIATLSENANPDYSKLKSMGVVGVMLYGGGLYNEIRMLKQYRSKTLHYQVQQSSMHDIPYGLYVDVRSRTVEEAERECRELRYLISAYPPTLGIWLRLGLGKNVGINDNILNVYSEKIDSWGLSSQYGIYATRNQLGRITWKMHQNKYYLWLIDNLQRLDPLNELLTPSLFKL